MFISSLLIKYVDKYVYTYMNLFIYVRSTHFFTRVFIIRFFLIEMKVVHVCAPILCNMFFLTILVYLVSLFHFTMLYNLILISYLFI